MPPRKSRTRKRPFATARFASARRVPASSIPMPANAMVPSSRSATAATSPPDGSHPNAIPVDHDGDGLDHLQRQHVERLGAQEPAARQRRGAEALQHAVSALVTRRDAEAHHRRRHHGEREDTGHEEVDRMAQRRVHRVDLGEEHEDAERDHERDEQALAPPHREQHLDARLRAVIVAAPSRRLLPGELEEDVLERPRDPRAAR